MLECRHDENIILSFKYSVNSKEYTIEKITKKIKETGELMNINLIDHVIIGKDKYYSFLENRRGGLI